MINPNKSNAILIMVASNSLPRFTSLISVFFLFKVLIPLVKLVGHKNPTEHVSDMQCFVMWNILQFINIPGIIPVLTIPFVEIGRINLEYIFISCNITYFNVNVYDWKLYSPVR